MRIGVEREWWQNYGSKYKSALRIGHTLQVPYCSVASGSRSCGACRLVWLRGGGGAGAFGVGHEPSAAVPRSSATSAPSAASRTPTMMRARADPRVLVCAHTCRSEPRPCPFQPRAFFFGSACRLAPSSARGACSQPEAWTSKLSTRSGADQGSSGTIG